MQRVAYQVSLFVVSRKVFSRKQKSSHVVMEVKSLIHTSLWDLYLPEGMDIKLLF